MEILRQMIDDQWQRISPDRMVVNLTQLAGEVDRDTELQQWLLVHLHLARAHTMQLDFDVAEKILLEVVSHLTAPMVLLRSLYNVEKGRILMATGEIEQGLRRWDVAEKVALQHGLADVADDAARLKQLYRELLMDTEKFTYKEMMAYVQQSLAIL